MGHQPLPLVRSCAVNPIVDFVTHVGGPAFYTLEAVGLSFKLLERPEEFLPLHQGLAFVERAARSEHIEDLGLLAGARASILDLGAFGQVIRGLTTLFEAIRGVVDSITLLNSGEQLWLMQRWNDALLCHRYNFNNIVGQRHGDAYTLMLLIDLIRLAAGPKWRPKAILLPAAEIVRRKNYETCFDMDVTFDGDIWAVVFDRALLARPLKYVKRPLRSSNDQLALLQSSPPPSDFLGSVRQAIKSSLRRGYPHITMTAEMAGMSARTFQRRLSDEGVSYSQLVGQARFELAAQLLRNDGLKVIDVALEIGYADPFNFTRAFRRWSGLSPREFKRHPVPLP